MAKPIFIITVAGKYTNPQECGKWLSGWATKLSDYHVLALISFKIEDNKFEMYSIEHIDEIELEDLKKRFYEVFQETRWLS